MKDNRNS